MMIRKQILKIKENMLFSRIKIIEHKILHSRICRLWFICFMCLLFCICLHMCSLFSNNWDKGELWGNLWLVRYAGREAIIQGLFASAFILFLDKYSKYFYCFVICCITVFLMADAISMIKFNQHLTPDLPMILLTTNSNELKEFIRFCLNFKCLIIFLLGVFIACVCCTGIYKWCYVKSTLLSLIIGIIMMLPYVILLIHRPETTLERTLGISFVYGGAKNISEFYALSRMAISPVVPEFTTITSDKELLPLLGVIVIGESSSRNYWHLYGYHRNTTPCMDALKNEMIVFQDVISVYTCTPQALKFMLTPATIEKPLNLPCSIVDIYKRAGYRVVLFSMQQPVGKFDSPVTLLFNNVSERHFIHEEIKSYDDISVIPFFERELKTNNIPTIVFIHLLGSHIEYGLRYPNSWRPFEDMYAGLDNVPSEIRQQRAEYDNTIAYTDHILGKIVDILAIQNRPAFMFYFSDHGETPSSLAQRNWEDNDVVEIPMILWTNKEWKERNSQLLEIAEGHSKLPLSTEQMFSSLCSLANIKIIDLEKDDIFSTNFQPLSVRRTTAPDKKIRIYQRNGKQ